MTFQSSELGLAARRLRAAVRGPCRSHPAAPAAQPHRTLARRRLPGHRLLGRRGRRVAASVQRLARLAGTGALRRLVLLSSCICTAAPSPLRRQLTQTFVTMGLLALLLVGGLPLIDALANQPATASGRPAPRSASASPCATSCCSKTSISTPRPRRAGTSICSASRSAACSSTIWCSIRTRAVPSRSRRPVCGRGAGHRDRRAADRHRRGTQPALGHRYPRLARRGVPQPDAGHQRRVPAGPRA